MTSKSIALALGLFVFLSVLMDSVFIVNPQSQALVLRFRDARREIKDPGLYFKIPLIDEVAFFERRILPIESASREGNDIAILADRKQIIVDAFARYSITDPLKFFQRLNNERNANTQLYDLVNSSMRQVLGTFTMKDILSADRDKIMRVIKDDANRKADEAGFGVEFVDVRIRRADLPAETSQSIFGRMKSERQREAKEFRAKGEEDALKIRSEADKERVVLLSEARRKAEELNGQGEEEALKTLAKSTGRDTEFYKFYRSLQAYRTSINKDTPILIGTEGAFFHGLNQGIAK